MLCIYSLYYLFISPTFTLSPSLYLSPDVKQSVLTSLSSVFPVCLYFSFCLLTPPPPPISSLSLPLLPFSLTLLPTFLSFTLSLKSLQPFLVSLTLFPISISLHTFLYHSIYKSLLSLVPSVPCNFDRDHLEFVGASVSLQSIHDCLKSAQRLSHFITTLDSRSFIVGWIVNCYHLCKTCSLAVS